MKKLVSNKRELVTILISMGDVIAWDTETTDLRQDLLEITGFSMSNGKVSFYAPVGNGYPSMDDYAPILNDLFKSLDKQIAHNWVFDARVMAKYGVDVTNPELFDTMVAHHLIDENSKHGLKYLVENLLGMDVTHYDDVGSNHYTKKFFKYGLEDALNTFKIYERLLPEIVSDYKELFFKVEMPFQRVLLEMALTGVVVDKNLISKQQEVLEENEEFLLTKLCEETNTKYEMQFDLFNNMKIIPSGNFNSSHFVTEKLLESGVKLTEKTETGAYKVGTPVLKKIKGNSFVDLLLRYKIVSKLLAGFIKPLPSFIQSDGRVRPYFKDTGTKTGRLSSSKPNLQQLSKPKCYKCGSGKVKDGVCQVCNEDVKVNIREIYTVPEGYKMFSADYSGQEICVMAHLSGDDSMIESLHHGYDLHLSIANQFYSLDIPKDDLSKESPNYKGYKDKFDKERSTAKTITFGLAYGKSAYGFAQDFGISEDEAQKIVDDYFRGVPKLKQAIDDTHHSLTNNGYVTSMAGRKRHFKKEEEWMSYSKGDYRQSFNFLIQGFSADMIRMAANKIYFDKKEEWGLSQIMTVHDELVFQVKEEYVEEATLFVKYCMENILPDFKVPLVADVEIGDNYGNAK